MDQEKVFKLVFFVAVVTMAITCVGFFLLGVKIALLFTPEVQIAGMSIKNVIAGVVR